VRSDLRPIEEVMVQSLANPGALPEYWIARMSRDPSDGIFGTHTQRRAGHLTPERRHLVTKHHHLDGELSTVTPMKAEQLKDSDERQV
jgi:hypothetical protein